MSGPSWLSPSLSPGPACRQLLVNGPAWSEPRLLALAFAFEQATTARRPPQLLPTVELT